MEYLLACECGSPVPVSAAACGTAISCACGRRIAVPTLRELKGLPAAPAPPRNPGVPVAARSGVPPSIEIAGVIWLVAGLAVAGTTSAVRAWRENVGQTVWGAAVAVCAAFALTGGAAVRGRLPGTLAAGVCSLVVGVLALLPPGTAVLLHVGFAGLGNPSPEEQDFYAANAVCALAALGLLAAGHLAVAGRSKYESWRAAEASFQNRRRG